VKTEGGIKNGQYRNTGRIGHIRHRTKTNKQTKNTTQHNTENEKDEQHGPHLKTGVTNLCLYKHFGVGLLLITKNYLLSKQNEDLWYYSFVMHGSFFFFFYKIVIKILIKF